ncbi:hypothetical protein D3C79_742990 [compost metagenome]
MGKYVALDKTTGATPDRSSIGVLGGNAVVHHHAAFAHCPEQPLAIQRQVGMADVFEHTDTHYLVEAAVLGQVTVIKNLQLHLPFQVFGLDPFTGQLELLLAQGDAEHLGAELPRRIARQPAPATTDIEQVVAFLQAQLAAQVLELVLLGLLQRVGCRFEIGA